MKCVCVKILVVSMLFSFKGFAQNYRFEISEVSLSVKQNGKWSDFAPFKEAKIVATLDSEKDRITVYSEIVQYYKIYKYYDKVHTDGKDIISFECLDQDSERCIVEIHTRLSNNTNQLYVRHQGRIIVYNMKYVK